MQIIRITTKNEEHDDAQEKENGDGNEEIQWRIGREGDDDIKEKGPVAYMGKEGPFDREMDDNKKKNANTKNRETNQYLDHLTIHVTCKNSILCPTEFSLTWGFELGRFYSGIFEDFYKIKNVCLYPLTPSQTFERTQKVEVRPERRSFIWILSRCSPFKDQFI